MEPDVIYEMKLITLSGEEIPYMKSRSLEEIMDHADNHHVKRYAVDKTTVERVIQNV